MENIIPDSPCHILVCTPKDLMLLPSDLSHVSYLVFDDADNTIRSWAILQRFLLRVSVAHELIAVSASPNKAWLKTIPTATKLEVNNISFKKSNHHYVKYANQSEKLHFLLEMCAMLQKKNAKALVFMVSDTK